MNEEDKKELKALGNERIYLVKLAIDVRENAFLERISLDTSNRLVDLLEEIERELEKKAMMIEKTEFVSEVFPDEYEDPNCLRYKGRKR